MTKHSTRKKENRMWRSQLDRASFKGKPIQTSNFLIQTSYLLLLLAVAPCTFAGPNREVIDANALYATEQFQEALDIYNRLAETQPENAELRFNQGAAQFQLGNMAEAKAAFESAGQLSDNPRLQALASYNLGNCALQRAQEHAAEDPKKAIDTLFQGVQHFKNALTRDGNLEEAANNLELSRRAIQQLRQQQKEQEKQQQEQQQKQDEAKEKLDELIEEQEESNQQSEESAEQQQDPAQTDPSQQELNEQADQQQSTREDTEELAESMSEGEETPSPMDEAKEHAEKAAEKQKEAEEHLRNQEPEKANEAQEEALDELKQARESLDKGEESDEEQSQDEQQPGEEGEGDEEQKPSEDPSESDEQEEPSEPQESAAENMKEVPPPDATARDILNQEKQNKEQRNLRRMMKLRPVEKDW